MEYMWANNLSSNVNQAICLHWACSLAQQCCFWSRSWVMEANFKSLILTHSELGRLLCRIEIMSNGGWAEYLKLSLLNDLLMAHSMIVFFICCLYSNIFCILVEVCTPSDYTYTWVEIVTIVSTSLWGTQTTYRVCHIDIDSSLDEGVDLLHQTIPTCLQQFYLLEQHEGGEKGKHRGE